MRRVGLALGLTLALCAPAFAMDMPTLSMVRGEIDAGDSRVTWDTDAWIGGDTNKFRIKSEGDTRDGDVENAQIETLWSRRVADFWDLQAGLRVDVEPETRTYLAFGVQGLAPYQFETEATAYVSEDGDLSAKFKQSIDLHFTQRLVGEPHLEIKAATQDDAARALGAGLTGAELGLQVRYEITRKFAPYVDVVWERSLGETASIARRNGDDVEDTAVRAGLRFWF